MLISALLSRRFDSQTLIDLTAQKAGLLAGRYACERSDNALFLVAQGHAFLAGTCGTFVSSAKPARLRDNTA